jgi:hypothetical protein
MSAAGKASLLTVFHYSLINTASYSGPVFQLRRSSDDAVVDFYGDAYGNLGTAVGATGTKVFDWLVAEWLHLAQNITMATETFTMPMAT